MRRKLRQSLDIFKRSGFADSEGAKYVEIKRSFLELRRSKKGQYESSLLNSPSARSNPKDFGTAVNRFRLRPYSFDNVRLHV